MIQATSDQSLAHIPSVPSPSAIPPGYVSIAKFTVKTLRPIVEHDVYVSMRRPCRTIHELCRYLLGSERVRANLMAYINNVPDFQDQKLRISHPLLPTPIILPSRRHKTHLHYCIRLYYLRLLTKERIQST